MSVGDVRLQVEGLHMELGGISAVQDATLSVSAGEILGLIGPNGAGKTTLVNAVSGYLRPTRGRVRFAGADITGWAPEAVVGAGLARPFQGARLFPRMNVFENVLVAALAKARRRQAILRAQEMLERFNLTHLATEPAQDQPTGVQRRLGLARALASSPTIVLLDEPAAGLNDQETDELRHELQALRTELGLGIVVIEHDMSLIMRLCDRLHVLDSGRSIFTGLPADARKDDRVVLAYLGRSATA